MKSLQWFLEKMLAPFRQSRQKSQELAAIASRRPFIGRIHELAEIESLWNHVCQGDSQLLKIAGEQGIGKKTLIRHFICRAIAAKPNALFTAVNCYSGGPSFAPIFEILRRLSLSLPEDYLGEWLAFSQSPSPYSLAKEVVKGYYAELSQESVAIPEQFYQAIFEVLARAGRENPLIIVIDNYQDCDSATIGFLSFLAQRLKTISCLLVVLCQDQFAATEDATCAHCHCLKLPPLSRSEMEAYLLARFPCHQFGHLVCDKIYRFSQGIPLILQELTDLLVYLGILAPDKGKWTTISNSEFSWPQNYQDIVRQHILAWRRQAAPRLDQAILLAAIQGRSFSLLAWQSYFGDDDFVPIVAAFAESARCYRVIHFGVEAIGHENPSTEGIYRFLHPLYPQILLETLSEERQQGLHFSLAQLLEKSPLQSSTLLEQLIFHFGRAKEYATAAGYCYRLARYEQHWQNWQKAEDYCCRGLENIGCCQQPLKEEQLTEINLLLLQGLCLVRRNNDDGAHPIFRQALEKAHPFPQAVTEAIYWLGQTEKKLGLLAQAQQTLQQGLNSAIAGTTWRCYLIIELADTLARQHQWGQLDSPLSQLSTWKKRSSLNPALAWIILIKQGRWREQERKWPAAVQFYRQAVDSCSKVGDPLAGAISALYLARMLEQQGSWCKSIEQYQQAWEYFRHREPRPITCQSAIGSILVILGQQAKGQQLLQHSYRFACQSNNALSMLVVLHSMGDTAGYCGQWAQAREYYQQALVIAEKISDRQRLAGANEKLAMAQIELAEWEQCQQQLQQALALRHDSKYGSRAIAIYWFGRYHLRRYDYDEAMNSYQQSMSYAKKSGDQLIQALALDDIAVIQSKVGKWQDALLTLQKSLKIKENLDMSSGQSVTLCLLGDLYCKQQNFGKACQYYNSSQQINDAIGDIAGKAFLSEKLGLLYLQQGKEQKAIDNWRDSLELRRQIDDRNGCATLHAHIAKAYRQLLRCDEALTLLDIGLDLIADKPRCRALPYVFNQLGHTYFQQQEFSCALDSYQRGAIAAEGIYDLYHQGKILNNIGEVRLWQRQLLSAMENFSQALVINEQIESVLEMAQSYEGIARTYIQFNRIDKAIDNFQNALGCWKKADCWSRIAEVQKQLGNFCAKEGKIQEAGEHYHQSLAYYKNVDSIIARTIESQLEELE